MIESPRRDPVTTPGRVILGVRFGAGPGSASPKGTIAAVTMTEYGSGWYHDAAVREADDATTTCAGERRTSAGWADPA